MSTQAQVERAELLATIREGLKALRGWLPEPQNKIASDEYDKAIVNARRKYKAALEALEKLGE